MYMFKNTNTAHTELLNSKHFPLAIYSKQKSEHARTQNSVMSKKARQKRVTLRPLTPFLSVYVFAKTNLFLHPMIFNK